MTPFWVNRLGWTLLHFLWQGTLIAILYAIARRFLQRAKLTQPRDLLACVAMGAMLVAVGVEVLVVDHAERVPKENQPPGER